MAYRNPRLSELENVLTKVALERSCVVLCSPDWGANGVNEYWRTLLDILTLTSVQSPDEPCTYPLAVRRLLGNLDGEVCLVWGTGV